MNELVDKVANAIYATFDDHDTYVYDLSNDMTKVLIDGRINLKVMARAAIAAMREPTEAMLQAVLDAEREQGYCFAAFEFMSAEDGWPIMIDAALDPHPLHDDRPADGDHPGDHAADDELHQP